MKQGARDEGCALPNNPHNELPHKTASQLQFEKKVKDLAAGDYHDVLFSEYSPDPPHESEECLTNQSGTQDPEPTGRDPEHAASALTRPVSSGNTASTSAANASARKQQTSASSSIVELEAAASGENHCVNKSWESYRQIPRAQFSHLRPRVPDDPRLSEWQTIKIRSSTHFKKGFGLMKAGAIKALHGVEVFPERFDKFLKKHGLRKKTIFERRREEVDRRLKLLP